VVIHFLLVDREVVRRIEPDTFEAVTASLAEPRSLGLKVMMLMMMMVVMMMMMMMTMAVVVGGASTLTLATFPTTPGYDSSLRKLLTLRHGRTSGCWWCSDDDDDDDDGVRGGDDDDDDYDDDDWQALHFATRANVRLLAVFR
jgi:hypothetical protein